MGRIRRLGIVVATTVVAAVATPLPSFAAAKFGPSNPAWAAYYASPNDTSTWDAFCAGGGGTYLIAAVGVPACGPTPATGGVDIMLPNNGGPTPGFQCVEFAERYLYVKLGWSPINSTNGAQVVKKYANQHSATIVKNGSGALPQVGAVMSFSGNTNFSDVGHVAVVTNVSANQVTIVGENQNTKANYNGYTAGQATMSITGNGFINSFDSSKNIEWLNLPSQNVAPKFTAVDPPGGRLGVPYSYNFTASGAPSPTFVSVSGVIPGGLILASSGLLSGTPTLSGTWAFKVRASNAAGSVTKKVNVTISPGSAAPSMYPDPREFAAWNPHCTGQPTFPISAALDGTGFRPGEIIRSTLNGSINFNQTVSSPNGSFTTDPLSVQLPPGTKPVRAAGINPSGQEVESDTDFVNVYTSACWPSWSQFGSTVTVSPAYGAGWDAGSTITFSVDGVPDGTATVQTNGSWEIDPPASYQCPATGTTQWKLDGKTFGQAQTMTATATCTRIGLVNRGIAARVLTTSTLPSASIRG